MYIKWELHPIRSVLFQKLSFATSFKERCELPPKASPFKSYRTTTIHSYLLPLSLASLCTTVVPTKLLCFHAACESMERDWLTNQRTLDNPGVFKSLSSGHSTNDINLRGEVIENLVVCPIPPLKKQLLKPYQFTTSGHIEQQAVI